MLQIPMIEQLARLRRFEIAQEICTTSFPRKYSVRAKLQRREKLDLNIRISLQPRLSFSIWVGRRA